MCVYARVRRTSRTCRIAPHHRCDEADGIVFDGSRADTWSGSSFFFHLFVTQQPLPVRTCLIMASCRGAIVRCCFSFRMREERLCPSGGCGMWTSSYRCCRGRSESVRRGRSLNTLLVSLPASSRSSVVLVGRLHRLFFFLPPRFHRREPCNMIPLLKPQTGYRQQYSLPHTWFTWWRGHLRSLACLLKPSTHQPSVSDLRTD